MKRLWLKFASSTFVDMSVLVGLALAAILAFGVLLVAPYAAIYWLVFVLLEGFFDFSSLAPFIVAIFLGVIAIVCQGLALSWITPPKR